MDARAISISIGPSIVIAPDIREDPLQFVSATKVAPAIMQCMMNNAKSLGLLDEEEGKLEKQEKIEEEKTEKNEVEEKCEEEKEKKEGGEEEKKEGGEEEKKEGGVEQMNFF